MNPVLIQAGATLAAMTIIGYTVVSFTTGAAWTNGATVRGALKPGLLSLRQSSSRSRADLADMTLLAAVVLAMISLLVEGAFGGALVAVGIMWARTTVQRLTSQEHPLMAVGTQFSADLAIGIFAPLMLAQILMGSWFLAASHLAVCICLSWPAGGPGRRDGTWKPAWVNA